MTRKGGEDRGLFERGGKWWIVYADETGALHRESIGPKSLAREMYQRRKAEVLERRFRPESIRRRTITTAAAIDDALDRAAGRASLREMERHAKRWRKLLGTLPLRQVTWGMIERATAARRRDGVSEQTIYHELSFLRRVFSLARADGAVDAVPIRGLKPPRTRRVRYLTDEEEARLLAKLEPRWHPHVRFAIHTGLRAKEQFRLTWDRVDFRAKVVRLTVTKGDRPREVPLNADALAILRELPRALRGDRVWVNRDGRPINYHNFYNRVFLPAVRAAKLDDLRWHDLRHTFASRLAMAGVDLYTIAELLGHGDLQMTQRYAHLSPAHRTRAVSVLEGRGTPTPKAKRGKA